jgi:phosphoribosyl 1,2-cyclic phosphate phosphodiesterase
MTTLGFVFTRNKQKLLAYYTDCQEVSLEAIMQASGTQILVLDALRDKPHPTHLNFSSAIQAAHMIQPKKTFFTHCCHEVSHAKKERELPSNMFIAYDQLKVSLDNS